MIDGTHFIFPADFKVIIPSVSESFNVVDVVIGVSVLILAVIVTIIGTRFYNRLVNLVRG